MNRNRVVEIVNSICDVYKLLDIIEDGFEDGDYKAWYFDDEYYILSIGDFKLINWYKHVGRVLHTNMSESELRTAITHLIKESEE